jgi:hypothetical protein
MTMKTNLLCEPKSSDVRYLHVSLAGNEHWFDEPPPRGSAASGRVLRVEMIDDNDEVTRTWKRIDPWSRDGSLMAVRPAGRGWTLAEDMARYVIWRRLRWPR